MTRKEEIRERATNFKASLKNAPHSVVILKPTLELYTDFILELTAPESSPAPLESQEILWNEFEDIYLKNLQEELPAYGDRLEAKSKFILIRRTEGDLEK